MLERLDSIRWSELTHAYGSAHDVPGLLRALTSPDDGLREEALSELFGNIWHQGTVYEATAHAVPFLLELAADSVVPGRAELLGLIGAIAESDDGPRAAHEEVLRKSSVLTDLLTDGQPLVRATAAYVLGSLHEKTAVIAARIRERIEIETDAVVRTGMFLGLAALRDSTTENVGWLAKRFETAPDERERFAAAVALAHSAHTATPDEVIFTLANACGSQEKDHWFTQLPWDTAAETLPRRALVAAGSAARVALTTILKALATTSDAIHASFLLEDALAIVFGGDEGEPMPSALDDHQRGVLASVLDVPIVWSNPRVFDASFGQYSLPATRDGLKKLLERR